MLNFYFILLYIILSAKVFYCKSIIECSRCKKDKIFLFFSMGLLIILNCLRGENVGNDTFAYKSLFSYYNGSGALVNVSDSGLWWMNDYIEPGYRTLNVIISKITKNYQIYLSVIVLIIYISTLKFIKEESSNVVISTLLLFLLFYHFYMNALRQAIAISILLLSFTFLKKEKYFLFFCFVLLACLFHKTAIVSLLLIPLMHKRNYSFYKSFIVLLIVLGASSMSFFRSFLVYLGYSGKYLNQENGLSVYANILLSIIFFFCAYFWKKTEIKPHNFTSLNNDVDEKIINVKLYNFYSRIPVIHLCISIASLNIPFLSRCSNYFTIFYVTGIPYFISNSKQPLNNTKLVFRFLMTTIVIYLTGIIYFRPEWYTEFNYKFFWQS